MKRSLLLFLLTSCAAPQLADRDLPPRKQKQRIAALQKKVEAAQAEEQKVKKELTVLNEEIQFAQLSLIRKQIEDYEKKMPGQGRIADPAGLFFKERELLHSIIQNGPYSARHTAEALLDRILRIITKASDGE